MGEHKDPADRSCNTVDDWIGNYPFDDAERAVLDIARRFFSAFSAPERHGWIGAFTQADRFFGPQGAALAYRILSTIQVLRSTRMFDFSFINPDCPCCREKITAEERQFLFILHALRRDRPAEATLNAMMVCSGHSPEPLVAATVLLSEDMARVEALEPVA
ncbi:MAG: hypothetical protein AAF675_06465 [Pseudomonadota bacterium]